MSQFITALIGRRLIWGRPPQSKYMVNRHRTLFPLLILKTLIILGGIFLNGCSMFPGNHSVSEKSEFSKEVTPIYFKDLGFIDDNVDFGSERGKTPSSDKETDVGSIENRRDYSTHQQDLTGEIDEVISHYLAAVDLMTVTASREMRFRLLDLYVEKIENLIVQEDLDEITLNKTTNEALSWAKQLKKRYSDDQRVDHILYQTAKIYAYLQDVDSANTLLGKLVDLHPDSQYFTETQFRRGDYYFGIGDYEKARKAYISVSKNNVHDLFNQSVYMAAWSYFKEGDFNNAVEQATLYLDNSLGELSLSSLKKSEMAVINDVIRVMIYSFGYLDGAQSLAEYYRVNGSRTYEPEIYEQYIQFLIAKERYAEALQINRLFVLEHPNHEKAPYFHHKLVNNMINYANKLGLNRKKSNDEGVMVSPVQNEKIRYITLYGLNGLYGVKTPYRPVDLVRSDIHNNQTTGTVNRERQDNFNSAIVLKNYLLDLSTYFYRTAAKESRNKSLSRAYYIQAVSFYKALTAAFTKDADISQYYFLLAESLYGAGNYGEAVDYYHLTAYQLGNHANQVDSAYAEITTLKLIIKDKTSRDLAASEIEPTQQTLILRELKFVDRFFNDSRSPSVLVDALTLLISLDDKPRVVKVSNQILSLLNISQTKKLPVVSKSDHDKYLNMALVHKTSSLFQLASYEETVRSARTALNTRGLRKEYIPKLTEMLASSLYKLADESINKKDSKKALSYFSQIIKEAPLSKVAPVALYDSSAVYVSVKQWGLAIGSFESFLKTYPSHPLAKDIPEKLAYAYEEDKQWHNAATHWLRLSEDSSITIESKALRTLRSARLFEKSGDTHSAILRYRDYAHAYPDPVAEFVTARGKLIELYGKQGDLQKQYFWVNKVLKDYKVRSSLFDSASMNIVRQSAKIYADEEMRKYQRIKITYPLNKTLREKKKSLSATVKSYELLAQVGDKEASNNAIFKIGEIYQSLAEQILDSPLPENLSELELSQYEILLEEAAYPFEEQAIEIHEINAHRITEGSYDQWTKQSLKALESILPVRYQKPEEGDGYSEILL